MSPTDKGANTPDSPETPEPNVEPTPAEPNPSEADAPIGNDYPAPESFASAGAPGSHKSKRFALIGAIVAVIAAVAVIVTLLVVYLWPDSESADEAQLKDLTRSYVEAVNTGKATMIPDIFCAANTASLGEIKDEPAPEQQARIVSFDKIAVDGDKALVVVTIVPEGADADPLTEPMMLPAVNEDGWKFCQS